MPRKPKSTGKPTVPEAIYALSEFNRAARAIRDNARKIVTPMIPLFRHRFREAMSAIDPMTRQPAALAFIRDVLSEIGHEVEVLEISRANLASAKVMFPRVQLFKRAASLSATTVTDASRLLNRSTLVKFMSDHAYKLRRAIEQEPSKYVVQYGRGRRLSIQTWLNKFVEPAISQLENLSPGSFGFVLDFTVAGSLNDFLGAFFSTLGRKKEVREQIKAILGEVGGRWKITPKGIVQEIKGGRVRAAPRRVLEQASHQILVKILIPELQKLWVDTVKDFFLKEPTSVSRWFPNRPMARKGLRQHRSLLGMMLSGRIRFIRHASRDGIVGQFWNFNTELAPYWPVVEYGYPGKITAKRGRALTLKDPDPEWWQKVQWAFGITRTTRRMTYQTQTILHEMRPLKVRGFGTVYSQPEREFRRAKMPLLLPSGKRFSMLFHPSLFEPGKTAPVFYEFAEQGKIRRKQVTYSLTITPAPIKRKEVRGQRASMFIERIIAMLAERQKMLKQAFFNAAAVYLTAGEQSWNEIAQRFRVTWPARLGG
jgi:hypothetical protein